MAALTSERFSNHFSNCIVASFLQSFSTVLRSITISQQTKTQTSGYLRLKEYHLFILIKQSDRQVYEIGLKSVEFHRLE